MKIGLICGGPSFERGISLNSARSVMDHLGGDGIEIVPIYFDHKRTPYSISCAQLYSNTPSDFDFKLNKTAKKLSKTSLKKLLKGLDIVFPVMHGQFGEDGGIQKLLEEVSVPYVGSGVEACKRCFDKYEANEFIKSKGFYTLPSCLLKIYHDDHERLIKKFFEKHKIERAVVKPATGGSSIGVFSVNGPDDALEKAQKIFSKRMDTRVVVEPFCEGIEFTVIVLQNRFGMPVAILPTEMEMDYANHQIFDYRRKYLPTRAVRYHCPPRFSNKTIEKIQVQAEQLFTVLGMRDFARFDGWLMPDGNLWFSDFNPISGMEQNSFLFQQSSRVGFSHRDLLRYIVKNSARRNGLSFPELGMDGDTHSPSRKSSGGKKSRGAKPVRVIFGGETSERQVSLMSGTNVWLKLRRSDKYEPKPYLLGVDGKVWELPYALTLNHTVEEILENCLTAEEDEERLSFLEEKARLRLALEKDDVSEPFFLPRKMSLDAFIKESAEKEEFVFIALHGGIGENGVLQRKLKKAGVKFNGSEEKASELCMDKYRTGLALAGMEKDGVYSAPKIVFKLDEIDPERADTSWSELKRKLGSSSIIVKPRDEGCSAGIVKLSCEDDYKKYVSLAKKAVPFIEKGTFKNQRDIVEMPPARMKELMFERFIQVDKVRVVGNELKWTEKSSWIELTTGVLEKNSKYHALSPSLTVAEGEVLSVEEKFQGGTGVNMTPPPEEFVSSEILNKAKTAAEKVAKKVGIKGYCRIDMFLCVKNGDIIVIEVNTAPALTPSTVLYHQALAEKEAMFPTRLLEELIMNKSY